MAFELKQNMVPATKAGADLTADQYKVVKLDANGDAVLAGAGEAAIGILGDCPDTGDAATIYGTGATAKALTAGALAAGTVVAADASGLLVAAIVGDFVVGIIQRGVGAAGELASVYLTLGGKA